MKLRTPLRIGLLLVAWVAACDRGERPMLPPDAGDGGAAVAGDAGAFDSGVDGGLPEYPRGPYGYRVGDVFPELAWSGYHDAGAPWGPLTMRERFDPDGSRGVRAVLLTACAAWCAPCFTFSSVVRDQAQNPPTAFRARGTRFLTALVESKAFDQPAGQADVDGYIVRAAATDDIVADPDHLSFPRDAGAGDVNRGYPYTYVIDPRTMKIVAIYLGVRDDLGELDRLLATNGAPGPDAGTRFAFGSIRMRNGSTQGSVSTVNAAFSEIRDAGISGDGGVSNGCVFATHGPCRSYSCPKQQSGQPPPPGPDYVSRSAGDLTLTGGTAVILLSPGPNGVYAQVSSTGQPLWSQAQTLKLTAAGAWVPPFEQTLEVPGQPLLLTPVEPIDTLHVSRSNDWVLTWAAAIYGRVDVSLSSFDDGVVYGVSCSYPSNLGTGTVPAAALATMAPDAGFFGLRSLASTRVRAGSFDVSFEASWDGRWDGGRPTSTAVTFE